MAFFLIGCFAAAIGTLYTVVSFVYPDRPSVPREFPGGLEEELGGKYAVRVSVIYSTLQEPTNQSTRHERRAIHLTESPNQPCT